MKRTPKVPASKVATSPITELQSYTGTMLIAAPDLQDPNFERAAVLIIEHGAEGAFGLIVNKPLDVSLDQLADALDLPWGGARPGPSALMGGPVMTESVWLLTDRRPSKGDAREVIPGVVVTADADAVRVALEEPGGRNRILLGYSGWNPEQLDQEVAQGGWLLLPAQAEIVFAPDPGTAWDQALSALGVTSGQYAPSVGDFAQGRKYLM